MRYLAVAAALLLHYTMAGASDISTAQASNNFAVQLFKELGKAPGNVLVCPLSVHIALALVHQGAGGTTKDELGTALKLSGTNEDIRTSYRDLLKGLQDDKLKIATKLYPAISFKPKQDYVSAAQQYFQSDVQALDFAQAVDSANIINKFVENKTNNKIHDIIKPDSLNGLTRFIIVNAVHFKANWAKPFPPSFPDKFKVSPTETVQTDFLSQTDFFFYKNDEALGAKVLQMFYEGGSYSMVIVLPNKEDGIQELETKLASKNMNEILSGCKELRVEVTMPKFTMEQQMDLKEVLPKMGIQSVFDGRADLSGIAEEKGLYVDSVIQKTFIDVNEKGTEAAAATGVVTPLSGGTPENVFFARVPFHFYLLHNKRPQVILFNGRLFRPPQGKGKAPTKDSNNPALNKQDGNANVNKKTEILNRGSFPGSEQGNDFNIGNNAGQNQQPIYTGYTQRPNLQNWQPDRGQYVEPGPAQPQRPNLQSWQPERGQYVEPGPAQPQRQPEYIANQRPPDQSQYYPFRQQSSNQLYLYGSNNQPRDQIYG